MPSRFNLRLRNQPEQSAIVADRAGRGNRRIASPRYRRHRNEQRPGAVRNS